MRLSVFERNKLLGGSLDVNRGSVNSTRWNGITGIFVNSKAKNRVRIRGKIVGCDDATNMHA